MRTDGDARELLADILERRRSTWEADQQARMTRGGRQASNEDWKEKYRRPLEPVAPTAFSLPAGWTWATIDQLIAAIQYGTSAKTTADIGEGVPVLRMGNIVNGRIDTRNLKYLQADHADFPEHLLRNGE